MQFGDLQLIPFRDLLIHFRDLKLIHFRDLKLFYFRNLKLIHFRDLKLIHFRDLKLIHFRGLKLIHFGNWKFIRYVKSLLKILDLYNCDSSYFTRILINVATNFVDLNFFLLE